MEVAQGFFVSIDIDEHSWASWNLFGNSSLLSSSSPSSQSSSSHSGNVGRASLFECSFVLITKKLYTEPREEVAAVDVVVAAGVTKAQGLIGTFILFLRYGFQGAFVAMRRIFSAS